MNTSRELYPEERQQDILRVISQDGRAAVADLSRKYSVSEVTIRGDLQALADQGLIVRTHGGAVTVPQSGDLSLSLRRQQQMLEKERIGSAASSFVADGDAIFLDTSSTSLAIVRHLKQYRELTVLTNSLAIAQAVLDMNGVTLVMTGGVLRRDTASLIGIDGLNVLGKFNIKSGFFGAHGLTLAEGLTDVSVGEAEVKSQVVRMCHQVIAVLDATKWGRVGPSSFARVTDLSVIVTDQSAPNDLMEQVRVHGTRVVQV